MLKITQKLETPEETELFLSLAFEVRQKSRFKASLSNGIEVGIFLTRGQVLRGGDCLQAEDGTIIKIIAAKETVSAIYSDDSLLLSKVCYHLGNRHVPLDIKAARVCYLHDHVLDDMVKNLGLNIVNEQSTFEPEIGAYGHSSHSHSGSEHHSHK